MPEESAISLKNRTDKNVARQFQRPHLITRPPIQRKNCWNHKDNTEMIDTVVRGWYCSPIYLINRIDEFEEEQEVIEEDVFDGAHKLEALFQFIDDKFKLGKLYEKSPLKPFEGKKFSELPPKIRQKILDYKFTINIIDSETANDKDSLAILWKRVNKSGKQLNDFELALPIISDLVNHVLNPSLQHYYNSIMFKQDYSKRGEGEKLLQLILAVAEYDIDTVHLKSFQSKKELIKGWHTICLGDKVNEIKEKVLANKDKWLQLLKQSSLYMKYLEEENCFVDKDGKDLMDTARRGTELVFLLGRSLYHFPKGDEFRRAAPQIVKKIKPEFFEKIIRDDAGRNGSTQRRILRMIDKNLFEITDQKTPRLFPPEQIKQKLAEQNNICAGCSEKILPNQTYQGDHILPYSRGGKTEYTNLQVLHKKCNQTSLK
jgi:hypothetical protein